ncbi:MAG: rod shape-determining protein MreC [Terriglobales bacterium]
MEHHLKRSQSKFFLGTLLLAQLLLLGYQVRRPDAQAVQAARRWSAQAILPADRVSSRLVDDIRYFYQNYIGLRQAQHENHDLRAQLTSLELENMRLREAARELPRVDALLGFQRSFRLRTLAAQVISGGASADAQAVYLDRGSNATLTRNMPVMTPDGVVGKLSQVLYGSAQVLLLSDSESGAGVLIGDAGVHGILRGLGAGRVEVRDVLAGEPVAVGAAVITSGEDQVYPKGLPVGTVTGILPSTDGIFKSVQVRLDANLGSLEQVLVITGTLPAPNERPDGGLTAADIRQALLPGLPTPAAGVSGAGTQQAAVSASAANTPPAEGDALGSGAAPVPPANVPAPKKAAPVGAGGRGPGNRPDQGN